MDQDKLDDVIHFRVNHDDKEELKKVARDKGVSVGEILRKMMRTVKILFNPHLSVGELIMEAGVLMEYPKD